MLPAQVLQPPPPLAGAVGAADWGWSWSQNINPVPRSLRLPNPIQHPRNPLIPRSPKPSNFLETLSWR